jgi:hypothetical protein
MSQEDEEIQNLLKQSAELARDLRNALARSKELRREADRLREDIKSERAVSVDEPMLE